jgi:hypothetical protein
MTLHRMIVPLLFAVALGSVVVIPVHGLALDDVDATIRNLHNPDPVVRRSAVRALAEAKNPRVVPPLIAALDDQDEEVRLNAVQALRSYFYLHADPAIVTALAKKVRDPSLDVRIDTVDWLSMRMTVPVEPLITALHDDNTIVRFLAAGALGRTRDVRAMNALNTVFHIDAMNTEEWARVGEWLLFGTEGPARKGIGKGQCPLCHDFTRDARPSPPYLSLFGIIKRAAERIGEPRYLHPDTVQTESFPGSGRATTVEEYLAESDVCPACYVVEQHANNDSNGRESPMPAVNKPPISLTIDEMVAIDAWLYVHEGETPPPSNVMRAAYEKFIPPADQR